MELRGQLRSQMDEPVPKRGQGLGTKERLVDAEAGETGGGEGLEGLLGADGAADGLIIFTTGGDEGTAFEASTGVEFAVDTLLELHG